MWSNSIYIVHHSPHGPSSNYCIIALLAPGPSWTLPTCKIWLSQLHCGVSCHGEEKCDSWLAGSRGVLVTAVLACCALDVARWLVPLMVSLLQAGYLKLSLEFGLHQSYSSSSDEEWILRNTCPEQGVVPASDRRSVFGIVGATCVLCFVWACQSTGW